VVRDLVLSDIPVGIRLPYGGIRTDHQGNNWIDGSAASQLINSTFFKRIRKDPLTSTRWW
jgi:hypothetical protein